MLNAAKDLMDAKEFDLQFDIEGPFEDGSLFALCRQVPMIIGATSEEELRERILNGVNQLSKLLAELGPGRDIEFLRETGVTLRAVTVGPGGSKRTLTLPVLFSAAG